MRLGRKQAALLLVAAAFLIAGTTAYFWVAGFPEAMFSTPRATSGRLTGFVIVAVVALLITAAALWEGDIE